VLILAAGAAAVLLIACTALAWDRQPWWLTRLVHSSWTLVSAALTLIAGAGLAGAIVDSTSEENRAPEARIAIAALAFVVALTALVVVLRRLPRKPDGPGVVGVLVLNVLAVLLVFLLAIAESVSGRL
jgi:hypothetical protein